MKLYKEFRFYLCNSKVEVVFRTSELINIEQVLKKFWPTRNSVWISDDGDHAVPWHAIALVLGVDELEK